MPERLAAVVLFAALAAVHVVFLSYGTGDLLEGELHGNAFDSLGRSFLRGEATVAPEAIGNEAHVRDGKTYLYFGPVPALMRILPNALFPELEGRWSRLSCLLASLLSVLGFAALVRASLGRNRHVGARLGHAILAASVLAFGLGSPLLFLVSYGAIYHESILWGLAFGVWAIHFLLRILAEDALPIGAALGFSLCTGGALLSRVTFALPLLPILAILCLRAALPAWRRLREGEPGSYRLAPLLALALPALGACLFQAWYNHTRWGSIFVLEDHAAWVQTWFANGGTLPRFTPARIPGAFANYFGLAPPYFSWTAPYIHMGTATGLDAALYNQYREPVASLSVTSPWLVGGGLAGLSLLLLDSKARLAQLFALGFLAQGLVVLMFWALVQRYAADLLPLLIFGFGFGLGSVPLRRLGRGVRIALLSAFFAAGLVSLPATILPTLTWTAYQNLDAPEEASQGLKQRFGELDEARHRFLTR